MVGDLDVGGEKQCSGRRGAFSEEQPQAPAQQAFGFSRREVLELGRSQRELTRSPESESSRAADVHPDGDDDADLRDGQEQGSKRSKGHSQIIVGRASAAERPRMGDPGLVRVSFGPECSGRGASSLPSRGRALPEALGA